MTRIIAWLFLLQTARAAEVPVSVRVAGVEVPLSVEVRFEGVRAKLPPPGAIPSEDPHDRAHHAQTLCYFHQGKALVVLELDDSDFGMHSARLSRVSKVPDGCGRLEAPPAVAVAGVLVGLDGPEGSLEGFAVERSATTWTAKREWWLRDDGRWGRAVPCFWRLVEVEVTTHGGEGLSVSVMNWTEPDLAKSCAEYEGQAGLATGRTTMQ